MTSNRTVSNPGELRELLGKLARNLAKRLLEFHRFAIQDRKYDCDLVFVYRIANHIAKLLHAVTIGVAIIASLGSSKI